MIAKPMGLFKADLYRNFALGFALGAVIVFGSLGFDLGGGLVSGLAPAAEAAARQ